MNTTISTFQAIFNRQEIKITHLQGFKPCKALYYLVQWKGKLHYPKYYLKSTIYQHV